LIIITNPGSPWNLSSVLVCLGCTMHSVSTCIVYRCFFTNITTIIVSCLISFNCD
jgi:hypothetical protein